jgi:uncharacterized repeat protein (TIGR01451 family)
MSNADRNPPGTSNLASRLGVLVLTAAIPVAAWAVCTCGFGDGLFTLTTLNIDGNIADWAPVHADLDNNVCDGPSGGIPDLDAPVQSTGRDLTHFAFTWDATNIYLFTERFGSANNKQTFVYYADTDNDGLMETGETVIGVQWKGNNRQVDVYVFTYVAVAPGGDPMVDAGLKGDGYTLPGGFANLPPIDTPTRSGTWGSADGLQMEFFITWAELGLAPGAAFSFHVSSSNSSLKANNFAANIDDNLSGCGGGLGSTGFAGVTFTPDRALIGFATQTVVGVHTLTNTGNTLDFYDFTSVVIGDFTPTISYYEDVDGSGTITAGDILLTDTDGDSNPNTRLLAQSESISILIAYDVPAGAGFAETATVTTTAASDFRPVVTDFVIDTITVLLPPELLVTKVVSTAEDPVNMTTNPKAIPGSEVLYTLTVSNQGTGTVDNDAVVITDAIPANSCMRVTDLGGGGSGPVSFQDGTPSSTLTYSFVSLGSATDDLEFSNNGGATYTYTPTPDGFGCDTTVTHFRVKPKGTFAADTGAGAPEFELTFRVLVN